MLLTPKELKRALLALAEHEIVHTDTLDRAEQIAYSVRTSEWPVDVIVRRCGETWWAVETPRKIPHRHESPNGGDASIA